MSTHLLVVAGLLVREDGRVLLGQRPAGVHQPLTWEFPGGKVGPGETPESALIRELQEELGIHLSEMTPWGFVSHPYPDFHLVMLVYRCLSWQGDPQPLHAVQLGWFTLPEMASLEMPPADLPIVRRLLAT